MISDSQFIELDAEIWGLVAPDRPAAERRQDASEPLDAAMPKVELAPDAADVLRIERIIQKARFEAVVKDSVEFLFKTMGAGASELSSGVIAATRGEARSAGTEPPEEPDQTDA